MDFGLGLTSVFDGLSAAPALLGEVGLVLGASALVAAGAKLATGESRQPARASGGLGY